MPDAQSGSLTGQSVALSKVTRMFEALARARKNAFPARAKGMARISAMIRIAIWRCSVRMK